MTSSTNSGMARSTFSMPCSSLRQGMMTVMRLALIHGSDFLRRRRVVDGYHGCYEAACCSFSPAPAALVCARRPGRRAHGVYAADARGLDQYLANRLTDDHIFQVVTDPKQADAVFTDRIGEAFRDAAGGFVSRRRTQAKAERQSLPKEAEKSRSRRAKAAVPAAVDLPTPSTSWRIRPQLVLRTRQRHHLPGGRQVAAR